MIAITVYFDNAATTQVREEVRDIMVKMMCEDYGNPSSSHEMGRRAKAAVDVSRKNIAAGLGAVPEEIFFTSGGTEADNWAIRGCTESLHRGGGHMITAHSEHEAVKKASELLKQRGWTVTYLYPGKDGRISAQAFAQALREDTAFASVMLVNNETGAVNPVGDMVHEIRRRGLKTLFHTDAVQGFMKIPFTARSLGADLISISAHKIHGPKGIGALYVKKGVKLSPLLVGGAQEREKRAGTEAVPSVAGFGEAVRLSALERESSGQSVCAVREFTVKLLKEKLPKAMILSPGDSPYILSLSLPGLKSEVLMNCLEYDGIYVSKSSACKKGARSHVLEAMKLPSAVIDGAIRVSFSRYSTTEEAAYFIERLTDAAERLGKVMR